jgi:hypothetical protein
MIWNIIIILLILIGLGVFIIFMFNFLLRKALESFVTQDEHFLNDNLNNMDGCKKIDELSNEQLNFQTATSIPLSPYHNVSQYVGNVYSDDKMPEIVEPTTYGFSKPKLLYDGIWLPTIEKGDNVEKVNWTLTNGGIVDGHYFANGQNLFQQNKPFDKNKIDKSAVYKYITNEKVYGYYNDVFDDPLDIEVDCFPEIFTPNDIHL